MTAASDHPFYGITLRIVSAACYVAMAATLKLAGDHSGLTAPELVFYRAIFGLPVVLAWVAAGPGFGALRPRRLTPHVARGVLGTGSIILTFQAMLLLPLATSITIGFTAPIFATLLSAFLLGEAVERHRWAAIAVGFAGIVIVAHPSSIGASSLGLGLALLSAFGQGSVTVTIRHLGRTETAPAIVFWLFVTSATLTAPVIIVLGHRPDATGLALVAAGGVLGGVMQLLLTASIRIAPVAVLAPFDYLQIVVAAILSWLLWNTAPDFFLWAGGALITGSGIYTALRERRHHRARAAEPPVPIE